MLFKFIIYRIICFDACPAHLTAPLTFEVMEIVGVTFQSGGCNGAHGHHFWFSLS